MNDFQMNFLANDRRNDLRAEADRQRLSRLVKAAPERSRSATARRPRRLSFLFGRATA
jgi:hypothetical protein